MRKRLFLIFILLLSVWTTASAYDFMVDGIAYKKNSDDKSVSVTYKDYYNNSTSYRGSIVIPDQVKYGGVTYSVTQIGEKAFDQCTGLTSVVIGDLVTDINTYAFNGCSSLNSLTIGSSVSYMNYLAFNGCSGLTNLVYNAISCPPPSTSTNHWFLHSRLTSLTIGEGVKTIPKYLTYTQQDGGHNLTSLTIPSTVTSIGEKAFSGCRNLKILKYNAVDATISSTSFESCQLTSLVIGEGVKKIPNYLAFNQKELTSLTIPSTVTSILKYAFSGCTGVTKLIYNATSCTETNKCFIDCPLTSLTIGKGVKTIPSYLASNQSILTSMEIPSTVTSIGGYAFSDCSGINIFYCNAATPPTLGTNTFPSKATIYVKPTGYPQYINDSNWNMYNIINDGTLGYIELGINKGSGSFGGTGSGTFNDPYLIFNPIQLYNVRNFTGYSDVYFKLMSDIDLSEFIADNSPTEGWEPIGSASSPFMGHFDGDGHTISGLKINRTMDCVGFFSCLNEAEIKNLSITGTTIQGNSHIGTIAGVSQHSTITGVNIQLDVKGNEFIAGMIGVSQDGDIINNCVYNGNLQCQGNFTGGISSSANTLKMSNSQVNSNIIQSGQYTGGAIGYGNGIILDGNKIYCKNISGNNYTAGLVGYIFGSVSSPKFTNNTVTCDSVTGGDYTGGAIGYATDAITVTNCYSCIGHVIGGKYTGGFAGELVSPSTYINKCGAVANVEGSEGSSSTGGFVGRSYGTLNNLFAIGDIKGSVAVGGIVGYLWNNASVLNSYYSGNINASSTSVGGIVGSTLFATISKNYSIGIINGQERVGGVVGHIIGNATIKSNVAAGEVVNAVNGDVGRVYGKIADGATPTIGATGSNEANRGLTTMRIISQGLQITPTDGEQHGVNIGKSLLKYKSTFQGINWDFTNDWTILETESFPYKPEQCAPPVINKATSGATTVTGNCVSGGSVFVTIEGKKYQAQVSGNTWTATVDPLLSGATVRAYATINDKIQSYIVSTVVGYAGAGTEEAPYLIYTASDLANINSYSYYKVMNDIDLTEWINANSPVQGWIPVGIAGGGTMKQLDGNGKTITGLWFDRSSQNNCGLISAIENAIIKNLTVKMADGKTSNGNAYTGIVVGKATNSTLTDINVEGSVKGANYVAGIAGDATGTAISNCKATNVTESGVGYVAGIAGNTDQPVQECTVTNATITATGDYAGGVAGKLANAATNCSVQATINGKNYTGGIAGNMTGDAAYCQAEINLTGADYIGGIAGNTTGNVSLSTTTGQIITTDNENCRAGGIAGYTTADVTNCYSSAKTAGGKYAGGIAGYSFGKVDNCYSNGDVASKYFGAGVAGYLDGAKAAVNHCFANNNRIDVNDQTGVAMRVIGGFKNGAPTPQATNFANKAMVVSVNDVTQTIYDDVLEGKGVQLATLKQQATYTAQGWDFNETWGIEEGEGFPYLQWTAVEPEPEFVTGDANGDGFVRINDVVTTSNYILGDEPAGFVFAAADVNQDGFVRINDVVLIANIILDGGMNAPAKVAAMQLAGNDYMTAQGVEIKAGETRFIDIELNNDNAFSALQMDINLPDGLVLKGATLTGRADGHNLMTGRTVNGKATIAAFSTESNNFAGNNGVVIRLEVMAASNVTEDITLDNIFASTAKGELKQLDAVSVGVNTVSSINDITVGNGLVNVYNTAGQLVRRNANASEATRNLPAGIYIVNNKKMVVK